MRLRIVLSLAICLIGMMWAIDRDKDRAITGAESQAALVQVNTTLHTAVLTDVDVGSLRHFIVATPIIKRNRDSPQTAMFWPAAREGRQLEIAALTQTSTVWTSTTGNIAAPQPGVNLETFREAVRERGRVFDSPADALTYNRRPEYPLQTDRVALRYGKRSVLC